MKISVMLKAMALTLVLFAAAGMSAFAQKTSTVVAGRVVDAYSKQPLTGAYVVLADHSVGAVVDIDGNFSLKVNQDYPINIEVTFLGFVTKTMTLDKPQAKLEIELEEEGQKLDEIVVVGYSQGLKNAMTSATKTVHGEELENTNGTSFADKLQGSVPGLMISSSGGVPGSAPIIRLRGATSISASNSPIYIVDGVFINSDNLNQTELGGMGVDPLADINPDDIESVSVLKDAAATAAYGARAANGVIIINTKRGKKNSQTHINFKAQLGFAQTRNLWQLVTGEEHGNIVNQCWINDGKKYEDRPFRPVDSNTTYKAYGAPEDLPTYDRISDIFRTAFNQTYGLSISGGEEKTNFFAGIDYSKQQSTLKLTDYSRLSIRVNLDHSIRKNIRIGVSTNLSFNRRHLVRVGNGPAGFFQAALNTPTYEPVFKEDGSYNKPVSFDNHQAMLDNWKGMSKSFHTTVSGYLKWNITKDLSFKSSYSYDRTDYAEDFYYNTFLIYGQPDGVEVNGKTVNGIFSEEQVLNYLKILDKHTISAFLGTSYQYTRKEWTYIKGIGFPSNSLQSLSSSAEQNASGTTTHSALLSFFGGANYSYDSRYSIDFTLRADGSSRVGKNNRFGYFPAVGASWNIMNEKFFPKNDYVGTLRLKASFGLGGNENIGDFASLGLWQGGSNYDGSAGLSPIQLSNPDLKWETTRQINVGTELSLIKNRINLTLDYYHKYTYDLLLQETVPGKTGFTSIVSNSGEVSNQGVEFAINSLNISKKNFTWKTIFTAAHNTNRVEKMPVDVSGYYTMFKLFVGKPLYSMWVYKYLGVDPKTGDAIYQDTNKDGMITALDKVVVGDAWAKIEGMLKNSFSFYGVNVDFTFYYKAGNKVFNYTRMFLESGGTRGTTRSMQKSTLNYWTAPVDSDKPLTNILPRPKSIANADGSYNYEGQSSRFVEDGSFLRLRDLSVSYTLPKDITSKIAISKATLSFTASNLFLITKYSGPDPESNLESDGRRRLSQGLDFGMPPLPRSYVFGLNITF